MRRLQVSGGTQRLVEACILDDVRLDAARMDRGRRYGMPRDLQFHVQRVGEASDAELGGVVGGLRRHRDQPEDAGDVHDVPLARPDQVGQERLGPVDDAPEVDPHQPVHVLPRHGFHRRAQSDSGVVEDQVGLAVRSHDGLGPGRHLCSVRHVHDIAGHQSRALRRALATQRLGLRKPRRVDVGQRQGATPSGQVDSQCTADPRRGARDCRHLAIESPHHNVLSARRRAQRQRCQEARATAVADDSDWVV